MFVADHTGRGSPGLAVGQIAPFDASVGPRSETRGGRDINERMPWLLPILLAPQVLHGSVSCQFHTGAAIMLIGALFTVA